MADIIKTRGTRCGDFFAACYKDEDGDMVLVGRDFSSPMRFEIVMAPYKMHVLSVVLSDALEKVEG